MIYLLQVIIYTGLLLLVYLLLLRDKPMHKFNRVYLLSTTILPALLPFIYLPQQLRPETRSIAMSNILPEILVTNATVKTGSSQSLLPMLLIVYSLVAAVFLCFMVYKYFLLRRVISKADKEHYGEYILLKNTGYGPGSWRHYIFLSGSDINDTIIKHEMAHIRQHHTLDIIFIDLLTALLWPNVLLHFIKKELVLVHEYQADAAVGVERKEYSQLLLSSLFKTCTLPFTHSFIFHPIKRRIMMLNTNKTSQKTRTLIAITTILALCISVVTLQSCEQTKEVAPIVGKDNSMLSKKPQFAYGINKYLIENINYPATAFNDRVEGKVLVQFVIDKDGTVTNVTTVNEEPIDERLAKEAIRAVKEMPKWTPGEKDGKKVPVEYLLPVSFKLPPESDGDNPPLPPPPVATLNDKSETSKLTQRATPRVKGSKTFKIEDESLTKKDVANRLYNGEGLKIKMSSNQVGLKEAAASLDVKKEESSNITTTE